MKFIDLGDDSYFNVEGVRGIVVIPERKDERTIYSIYALIDGVDKLTLMYSFNDKATAKACASKLVDWFNAGKPEGFAFSVFSKEGKETFVMGRSAL